MPKTAYAYGGTITFHSELILAEKEKRIDDFKKNLSLHLHHYKDIDMCYYLCVSKEYHKVDGKDDPEAPHLHFILYSEKRIPRYRVQGIQRFFKDVYGRSQFYLMTSMKEASYKEYIVKDVEKNDRQFGGYHYRECVLEQEYEDFKDDQYEDYDDY